MFTLIRTLFTLIIFFSLLINITSCGKSDSTNSIGEQVTKVNNSNTYIEETDNFRVAEKGSRSNTSHVLQPDAPGTVTTESSDALIDASEADNGYIVIDYKGSNSKPKLQITGPKGLTYNYNLHGGLETFNLTQSDGAYQISVFDNLEGNKYALNCSLEVNVSINDEFAPFLYPNQYVCFDNSSEVVALGEELAYSANNDLDVVSNVYNYIIHNISYDTELASNVTAGYLPDPDKTLKLGTGICFDYAAVMASMLRSQGIPTRLEIGYAGEAYHAWISTYVKDIGWINGIIEFNGKDWELMDPTLASSSGDEKLRDFIGDGSTYTICYEY